MSKDRLGNFFEDFYIGMHIKHATPRTLTEGDRSLYIGLTGSRSALCTAQTNAALIGLDSRPLEDLLVFNTAFGKTVPDISLNAVANLGYSDVRFLAPVYSGDTLSVESEVIGLKENSNGKSGVVYVRSNARNQSGEEVLTWIRWVMVHKRILGTSTANSSVPTLIPFVASSNLVSDHFGSRAAMITSVTGSQDLWDDYVIGERINHLCGMTVNESDHSIATRLYQNTAKAHFDAFMMSSTPSGKRLVYGGHIMSICKALSYDGLENALSMLAINAGTHVAPTYAGDTVICSTMIVDKFELANPHVGGMRVRLIGAKNLADAREIQFPAVQSGRPTYQSNVVLDLDYTLAIPKKPN